MLPVHIWSDIACPWCYVGKRKLEQALASWDGDVEIEWHAFELNPAAPQEIDLSVSYAQRLATKYRVPLTQAESMIANMTKTAANEGLDFHFEKIRPGNTFNAHRLIRLAKEHGKQDDMKERFLSAYLCEGERIGHTETIARIASELLEPDEVQSVLASDAFAEDVRADEEKAAQLGIRGVPFFMIGRYGVSGAQPVETLTQILDRAREEQEPVLVEGAMCGPEGC